MLSSQIKEEKNFKINVKMLLFMNEKWAWNTRYPGLFFKSCSAFGIYVYFHFKHFDAMADGGIFLFIRAAYYHDNSLFREYFDLINSSLQSTISFISIIVFSELYSIPAIRRRNKKIFFTGSRNATMAPLTKPSKRSRTIALLAPWMGFSWNCSSRVCRNEAPRRTFKVMWIMHQTKWAVSTSAANVWRKTQQLER